MRNVQTIAIREIRSYFNSPIAYIVLGLFVAASMVCVYTLSKFFSVGQANVRALFRYVPIIFLVLVPGLTMRLWSEERKMGTLEVLLTLPVRLHEYVIGKFLGGVFLVAVALVFTLPIPITAGFFGALDPGPVIGGYLAAILLGATFVSVGTFLSAVTENQIVALLGAIMVGVLLYLPGTEAVTGLLPDSLVTTARSIAIGSRFESIERGVIDFRDLLYYGSLITFFLVANVAVLKARRWG